MTEAQLKALPLSQAYMIGDNRHEASGILLPGWATYICMQASGPVVHGPLHSSRSIRHGKLKCCMILVLGIARHNFIN
jgi:hypothetical protein